MNKWLTYLIEIVLFTIISILLFNGILISLLSIGNIVLDIFSSTETGSYFLFFFLILSLFLLIFSSVTITLIIMLAILKNYNKSIAIYAICLGISVIIYSFFIDYFFLFKSSNIYWNLVIGILYILSAFIISKRFFK